ncbi:MAG: PLDc N-terminal domain-containing protein, partial [Planctomycetota bacterium]
MLPILKDLFSEWPISAPILVGLAFAMSLGTVLAVLLDRRSQSQSAISWVLLVIVAPLAGPMLYWIFGRAWLSAKREASYRAVIDERRESRLRDEAGGAGLARRESREAVLSVLNEGQRHLNELLLVGHLGSTARGIMSATFTGSDVWAKYISKLSNGLTK